MSELTRKKEDLRKLSREVRDLERRTMHERIYPKVKKLEGTYWKYRNCYSCPNGDADKWWLYRKIIKVSIESDGFINILCLDGQIDKNGRLDIKNEDAFWTEGFVMDWTESNLGEWAGFVSKVQGIVSRLTE